MRILYFDCFSGISGDMAMGALLDLGIDKEAFRRELAKLNLDGYELIIKDKLVNGIKGTDVSVMLHVHEHQHSHSHSRSHNDSGHSHLMRNLDDINRIIDQSSLSERVKCFSKAVFLEIAAAEAKVHNKSINEVHFHEVGAVDSIVDIVGTAICIEMLDVDKVCSSELHDGKGTIKCQHGIIPVPVPAVMEMLAGSGIPLISEDIGTELVTPTGMALIKHMAQEFGRMPPMLVDKTGCGMGKRETGRFNALRVVMGTVVGTVNEDKLKEEEIIVLETNIDDMSPEILGYVSAKLFEAGALDVFYTPIYMKKGRPAFMLTVLSKNETEKKLADIVLMETSTLGIRRSVCSRYCMEREIVGVMTEFGEVRAKLASKGDFKKASPEYEDCRKIAEARGIPLSRVYEAVMEGARRFLDFKAGQAVKKSGGCVNGI